VLHAVLLAAADVPAAPVVGAMTFGVVVALVGHITKDPKVVAVGLAVLFLSTAAMVVLGYAAFDGGEVDPRDRQDPRSPRL
jgi:hypothetical protein